MPVHRLVGLTAFVLCFTTEAIGAETPNPRRVELEKAIAGKESVRAGDVFKNVDYLKEVPAATFLRIMDIGYSRGLGVDCEHCHVVGKWESDEKRPKRAAREMQLMMREINQTLKKLQNLDNPEAVISCSTCHRGETQPSLAVMPAVVKTQPVRPPQ